MFNILRLERLILKNQSERSCDTEDFIDDENSAFAITRTKYILKYLKHFLICI